MFSISGVPSPRQERKDGNTPNNTLTSLLYDMNLGLPAGGTNIESGCLRIGY
jgi:hypothetical protein